MRAWDCGTGSGQAAVGLAGHFDEVLATDASGRQLAHARRADRVRYLVCRSEAVPFPDERIDLVTVAQALHWFDFDAFFAEVRRVARPGGVLGIWGYGLLRISPRIDAILTHWHSDTLADCWLPERRHVDEGYENVPVPFEVLEVSEREMQMEWDLPDLLGYLGTWSAGRIYTERYGKDPLALIRPGLTAAWGESDRLTATWPLTVRVFGVR